jgi:two-component system chemotaxis response regulator CheB
MLGSLPHDFPMPVIIVAHIMPGSDNGLATLLDMQCPIRIKEADEHDKPEAGTAYLAPANYHLLVERDRSFSLSADPPVCFARPSADVLFESAAEAYGPALIGVILTGAGSDGSRGLIKIKDRGGVVIVQDPSDAEMKDMPMNALRSVKADFVEPLDRIAPRLAGLVNAAGTVSMHNRSSTDAMGRPL